MMLIGCWHSYSMREMKEGPGPDPYWFKKITGAKSQLPPGGCNFPAAAIVLFASLLRLFSLLAPFGYSPLGGQLC
jgi:hypothetical protein